MLDNDFDKQMAALEQSQREANESYASAMDRMAADMSQMSSRFEAEMKSAGSSSSAASSSSSSGSGQPQRKEGMREQMARGEAVGEVKQGRKDVGGGKRVM